LLENIPLSPVAEAVNPSYAKRNWNFGEGKRERRREVVDRKLMPKF
jgi:hypothetical protein